MTSKPTWRRRKSFSDAMKQFKVIWNNTHSPQLSGLALTPSSSALLSFIYESCKPPTTFQEEKKLENKSWCLFTFYGPLIYMKTFLGQEKHTWPQKIHWRQKQKDARKIAAAAALLASLKKIAMRCVENKQKRGLHLTRVFIKAPYYIFITSTINKMKTLWWNWIIWILNVSFTC